MNTFAIDGDEAVYADFPATSAQGVLPVVVLNIDTECYMGILDITVATAEDGTDFYLVTVKS